MTDAAPELQMDAATIGEGEACNDHAHGQVTQDFVYSNRLCDFIRQASPAPRHPTHGSYERNHCRPLYLSASRTPGSVSRLDARVEAPSENELEGFAVAARQRSDEREYPRAVPTHSRNRFRLRRGCKALRSTRNCRPLERLMMSIFTCNRSRAVSCAKSQRSY
jgi:hypothetical protein